MIRISLTDRERFELKRLRLKKNTNIGERAHYVLLCAEGKSAPEIARYLDRNIITIRLWLNRYLQEGLAGLRTRKPPGRPAQKAPAIESHLEELLNQSPQDYGYQESGWQINVLKDWFSKRGLHACDNTIVKSLNRLGYVYKRFSKTLPKNAPSVEEKNLVLLRSLNQLDKTGHQTLRFYLWMKLTFQINLMSAEAGLKEEKKSSSYRKVPLGENNLRCFKHANKSRLLEASR